MIVINLDKAKQIAHEKRRVARAEEFAPLDIKVTIPAEASIAEAARQAIREKYSVMQIEMDSATNLEELKSLLP